MERIFQHPVEEGKKPEWGNYFDTLFSQVKEPLRLALMKINEELGDQLCAENRNLESAMIAAQGVFKRWDLIDDIMTDNEG